MKYLETPLKSSEWTIVSFDLIGEKDSYMKEGKLPIFEMEHS